MNAFKRRVVGQTGEASLGFILILVGAISLLVWGGIRLYSAQISYPQLVGGHLKRAADANTIELAKEELEIAVNNMIEHEMTEGSTAVFWWELPSKDVGFWYRNVFAALEELKTLPPDSAPLEKTNVLMKLRETLTDNGEKGTVVTQPDGISIFPHNKAFFWWFAVSAVIVVVGLVVANKEY